MKIAFFSAQPYEHNFFDALNTDHTLLYIESALNANTVALAQGCQAVCCFVNDVLDREVLLRLQQYNIAVVAMRCAGFNNIDVPVANELGITIARVPEYSPYAVAEHAVGLILALNRHIHRAHNRIRENDYSLHGLMGFDLHGKTVGVIGGGKIGCAFVRIMRGFGCRVLVFDPGKAPIEGAEHVDLDSLWQQCQVISLHCPLNTQTHHMINAQTLSKMPQGAMLINTSRGGLIHTQAVINSLKQGHLGYLGIDVYEEEASLFFRDHSDTIVQDDIFARLTTFPNVIITGHQAFFTRDALHKIALVTLNNLHYFELGDIDKMETVN
ncbi:2-hydroxyacid dehydrogenase [Marinagarivorans algicola]|uniref:2-hydroxyacid dehydrogenase n=1 Tax=Marinagarivorans algicola TaxID=1513270 RepID=UPI0006B9B5FB|nr:2-hydroxyacid dehydrogenase [Marinagarivorans algicola]